MAMPKTEPDRERSIHPRLPDDVYQKLVAFAEAEDRSLNNAVVYLLRRSLAIPIVEFGTTLPADYVRDLKSRQKKS